MDPITLMGIGGTAISAFGAVQKGQANAAAANYQASVANVNAQIAQRNAEYEQAAGQVAQQEKGMQARYQIGEMRAAAGASNLDPLSGSKAAVLRSQQDVATQGQRIAAADTARRAYGYQVGEMQDRAQAQLYRTAAKEDELSGYISGAGSLLSGTSTAVSNRWKMQKLGM